MDITDTETYLKVPEQEEERLLVHEDEKNVVIDRHRRASHGSVLRNVALVFIWISISSLSLGLVISKYLSHIDTTVVTPKTTTAGVSGTIPINPATNPDTNIVPSEWLSCGDTPAESKRLGCKFQLWSFSWVPAPCYDESVEDEFLKAKDWGYYTDAHGHTEVNATFAKLGEVPIWSTWGQHYWHCLAHLKNTVRALEENRTGSVWKEILGFRSDHLEHCLDTITVERNLSHWDTVNIKMMPGGVSCRLWVWP